MESVVMRGLRKHCICRLCLRTGCRLVDILEDAEFLVKRAVEDLIQITVTKDELYQWMVCSICVEKVRDFYLFKRCCVENQEVYDSYIRKIIFPGIEVASNECGNITVMPEDDGSNWDLMVHDAHGHTDNNVLETPKATTALSGSFDIAVKAEDDGCNWDSTVHDSHGCTENNLLEMPKATMVHSGDFDLPMEEIDGEEEDDEDVSMDPLVLEGSSSEEEGPAVHRDSTQSWLKHNIETVDSCDSEATEEAEVWDRRKAQGDGVEDEEVCVEQIPVKAEGEGLENSMDLNSGHHPKMEVPGVDSESPPVGIGIVGTDSWGCKAGSGTLTMQASPTQGQKRAATECLKASFPASDVRESVFIVPLQACPSVATEEGQNKSHVSDSGYRREDEIISSSVLEEGESRKAVALYDSTRQSMRVIKQREKNDVKSIECTEVARNVSRIVVQGAGGGAGNQLPLSDKNPHGRSFKCDKCGSRFRSKYSIGKHMKVHNVLSVFKCSTCNLDFGHEGEYKGHKCAQGKFNSRTLHNAEKKVPDSVSSWQVNGSIQDDSLIVKKLLSCGVCSKSFKKPSTLAIHIRTHTRERPYSCTVCGREFARKCDLKKHLVLHDGTKPYSCSHCSKSFSHKQNLCRHMSIHTGLKPFSCSHCSKSFSQKTTLHSHMSVHTGFKPFSCSHCSKSFLRKHNLRRHMSIHTGLKPFSCYHCSKSFSRKHNLRRHMSIHTGIKPFSCCHCSKSFSHKHHLHSHMLVHTGLKPFSCSHCSKSFSQKTTLHGHMSAHTGVKPFSCSHCSKSFSRKHHLHSHMLVHTGLKPFSCSHCSKSFSLKQNLHSHMSIHTGLKPFSCSHCSKSFSLKQNLHSHMSIHTGLKPFSCNHCCKSFSSKPTLHRHMFVHTGLKPFSCSHCSKSFSRKDNLRSHMTIHRC